MNNTIRIIYECSDTNKDLSYYSDTMESKAQVSTALEGFNLMDFCKEMGKSVVMLRDSDEELTPDTISDEVVGAASEGNNVDCYPDLSYETRVSKACCAIVQGINSLRRLGIAPAVVEKYIVDFATNGSISKHDLSHEITS